MHHSTFLIGDRITLRPMSEDDLPMLSMCSNHPETRHALFRFEPTSEESLRKLIHDWDQDPHTQMLSICDRESGKCVGHTGLVRIDWVSRAAIFFIAIADPADWSKGYGGEATRMIADHAFDTLNLQRVQLHVWAKNEKGIRAYEKAGFEKEGVLRRAMFHAGEYEDFLVMAKLAPQ